MFNFLRLTNMDTLPTKYVDDIPSHLLMTKEEMEDELAMEFLSGEKDWDDLYEEFQMIEEMFKEGNN